MPLSVRADAVTHEDLRLPPGVLSVARDLSECARSHSDSILSWE